MQLQCFSAHYGLNQDFMKTANESLHFSPISLSEAKRNATSPMCNKCTVHLMEPSELCMHERNGSKERGCCVTFSILTYTFIYVHTDTVCSRRRCIVLHCKKEEGALCVLTGTCGGWMWLLIIYMEYLQLQVIFCAW